MSRVIAVCAIVARVAVALFIARGAVAAQSLSVSGDPPLLRISAAVPGSNPTSVSNATTTYTVSNTSGNAAQIVASLDAAMPVGTTLLMTLAPPAGATSNGAVALTITDQPLVINIPDPTNTTASITYQLSATVAAGVIPNQSRLVTFTILSYP